MKSRYEASKRYGYVGIDRFEEDRCMETIITCIKPHKLGYRIADELNEAYERGRVDAVKEMNDVFKETFGFDMSESYLMGGD